MVLNVDPDQLVEVAAALAEMSRNTAAALPNGWVVPAGADPISAQAVPQLNAHAASLFNGVSDMLTKVQRAARNVGAAAQEYTAQDDENARMVGGSGGDVLSNPVGDVAHIPARQAPNLSFPAAGGSVDPLTFAQQLHAGPGPGAAAGFAESIRKYAGSFHADALEAIGGAAHALQHWTPVGSLASDQITEYRGLLDQLGTGLGKLADGIDSYSDAFRTAKAKHPTPQEIIAARKELVAAMRSKNELGIQQALAKFEEQNLRSADTIAGYTTEVGAKVTGDGAESASAAANQSNAGGGGTEGGGAGDSSMLNEMMPALMSAMANAGQLADTAAMMGDDSDYSDYLDDYDLGYGSDTGYPAGLGSPGGGLGTDFGSSSAAVPAIDSASAISGPLPLAGASNAAGATSSGLPRTPVIESASPSSAGNAAAGRGAGGMPYMPMAPGMGGAGGGGGAGNDRSRVVAWHPDRLMYVDDTPHTEQVIGERPTIAPSVTPPTPNPGAQNVSQSGGNT